MTCDLLIRDCSVLAADYTVAPGQCIAITGNTIEEIGPTGAMLEKYRPAEVLDGRGKLAMPGFVDGHTHTSQQLLRGVISDEYPVIYRRFNMPYESRLEEEDVRLCTQLSCLEMIKSGITAFADAGSTYMPAMIEAVAASGLRASVTRATSDMADGLPPGMSDPTEVSIQKSEALYREFNGAGEGRVSVWFQIRSVASCTGELITTLSQMARDYGTRLHMHVCEYPESVLLTLDRFAMREVEYLESIGALGPHLLAAHCILLSDGDIRRLHAHGVKVVHCPRSNLGKGVTKTPQMLGLGMSVGLGTDGTAHSGLSMFKEITAFKHSQIVTWGVPYADNAAMPAKTLMELATLGGARAMGLEAAIGTLEAGKRADMILLDVDQPHLQPTHNLLNTVVEAGQDGDVKDMIVDGRVLMRDRVVQSLDEEKLMAAGQARAAGIAGRNGWAG